MMNSSPRRQRGAALIVGLVLLMILTLLGVSGMTTSSLELAMADNMQRGQYAFQAGESALTAEMSIAPGQVTLDGTEVRGQVLRDDIPFAFADDAGSRVADVVVDTSYQGAIAFGEGTRQIHFESRGIATTPSRGGRSVQRVGYFVLAPNVGR